MTTPSCLDNRQYGPCEPRSKDTRAGPDNPMGELGVETEPTQETGIEGESPTTLADGLRDEVPTDEYVIEKIVGTRQERDGTTRHRVRWYGYGREDDT
jgi:hypothetical protein